ARALAARALRAGLALLTLTGGGLRALPMAAMLKAAWGSDRPGAIWKLGLMAFWKTLGVVSVTPGARPIPRLVNAFRFGVTAVPPAGDRGTGTARGAAGTAGRPAEAGGGIRLFGTRITWAPARGAAPGNASPARASTPTHLIRMMVMMTLLKARHRPTCARATLCRTCGNAVRLARGVRKTGFGIAAGHPPRPRP